MASEGVARVGWRVGCGGMGRGGEGSVRGYMLVSSAAGHYCGCVFIFETSRGKIARYRDFILTSRICLGLKKRFELPCFSVNA